MNIRLVSSSVILVVLLSSLIIVLLQTTSSRSERNNDSGHAKSLQHSALKDYHSPNRAQMLVQSNDLQITISIIAMNRLESLKRLCMSILNIQNPNRIQINLLFSLEAVSPVEMVQFITDMEWRYGWKVIKKRLQPGGLITAVTESWFPSSDHELGLFLEDDIEVSPLCIRWIERVLASPLSQDERLMGISLYTPRVTETIALNISKKIKAMPRQPKASRVAVKGVSRVVFRSDEITAKLVGDPSAVFLMQTPCSWGAVFFPKQWMRFLDYMRYRLSTTGQEPPFHIHGSLTNGWQGSWKKFMFELMWAEDLFMLYPNFPGQESLSTNRLEPGVHVRKDLLSNHSWILEWQYTVPLLTDIKILNSVPIPDTLSETPALNLFGESFNTDQSLGVAVAHLQCQQCNPLPESNRFFLERRRNVRHAVHCHRFANLTYARLADTRKLTISISTMHRYDVLLRQIRYYSRSPLVSKIVVTWHDTKKPVPLPAIVNDVPVHFISYASDSLNNRFSPWMQIVTEAVLVLDDDIKVHLEDLHLLFEVWKRFPDNIVGFTPRGIALAAEEKPDSSHFPQFQFLPNSEDPPLGSPRGSRPRQGYELMLAQAMMLHKKHLYTYTCDPAVQSSGLHVLVDAHNNCEDIFMTGVVATASKGFLNAPPLFVHPIHPIGDFGRLGDTPPAHGDYVKVRTKCVNLINYYHYEKRKTLLPSQTSMVVPFLTEGTRSTPARVSMRLVRYAGIPHKYMQECLVMGSNQEASYLDTDACSWTPPRYTDLLTVGVSSVGATVDKTSAEASGEAQYQFPVYHWDQNAHLAY